jgi:hypothetical protein
MIIREIVYVWLLVILGTRKFKIVGEVPVWQNKNLSTKEGFCIATITIRLLM